MTKQFLPAERPRLSIAIAAVFFAAAINLVYLGFSHDSRLNAPPWIAYTLAILFTSASVWLVRAAFGRADRGEWMAFIFFATTTVVFGWISVAGDPRACTLSLGVGSFTGGILCRIGFGFFAVGFSAPLTIHLARRLFWRRTRSFY
jgi:hypothetical protein